MKLNHINLPVADVAAARGFFEEYFDFTCTETKGDDALAIMKGVDGFVLVLMSHKFNKTDQHAYPDAFHVGFLLPTRSAVMAQYEELKNGGIAVENEPAGMRGVFGFYFIAPGNVLVEVSSEG